MKAGVALNGYDPGKNGARYAVVPGPLDVGEEQVDIVEELRYNKIGSRVNLLLEMPYLIPPIITSGMPLWMPCNGNPKIIPVSVPNKPHQIDDTIAVSPAVLDYSIVVHYYLYCLEL